MQSPVESRELRFLWRENMSSRGESGWSQPPCPLYWMHLRDRCEKLTADVNHSGDALVPSDFAEQRESGPEGAVMLPRDADNDGRCRRREVLDCGGAGAEQARQDSLTRTGRGE